MRKGSYVSKHHFERVAHRGASGEAPENTLEAIRIAVEKYRVDRVEVDLCLTRDGVPVIFHDEILDRTTNGKGVVSEFTLEELKRLDAGFHFDPAARGAFPFRGKGVKIPTLEALLHEFPQTGFFLEIKDRGREIGRKILEVVERSGGNSRFVVGSFHGPTMRAFRRLAEGKVETFLAEDEVIFAYLVWKLGFKKFKMPGRFASLPRAKFGFPLDSASWIEFLHRQGVRVYFWTVNERSEMEELVRRGADGLITDYPDRLN